jgi:prepilin-type N-terminal cleavage/methylation domain-containing protein
MMDNLYNRVARRRRGEGGFTLIELLVVIAILAILAFIVIFNVTGVTNRGNSAACQTDVKTAQTAVDAFLNDNGTTVALTKVFPGAAAAPADITDGTEAGSTTPTNTFWANLVPNYIHSVPKTSECKTMTLAYANGKDDTNGYSVTGT